jgi:putative heme iron utilization protein
VQSQLEATEATMTSVDRLGFTLRVKTEAGMKGTRINFEQEAHSAQEVRKALVEMLRREV